jgi:hypothetical protein
VKNPQNYIADKLFSFTSYINNLEKTIKYFKQIKEPNEDRKKTIKILENKIEFAQNLRRELIPFCDSENLLDKILNFREQGYDLNYNYLLRDWGNFEDTENENRIKMLYHNWFFTARKKRKIYEKIGVNNVFKINAPINYEIICCLKDNSNTSYKQKVRIHTPLGTIYECFIDTINLLGKFDGKKSLSEIFNDLGKEYFIDEKVKVSILKVITELIKNQLLIIVK